ncbi:MAG: hypothetical protein OEU68_00040 [Nitrospira sp.]|nr:hypothetical protein [Nitrospira sp.]MDH4243764.1 hypothetical protein [Nitrospira sp.]MDH4356430.1 hypothetical protein [Nitrospira sp.]MDH5318788.1 hypothetical protein [Nitrospira sp.]
MTSKVPGWMAVGLVLLFLSGCRGGAPIYEVKSAPVPSPSGKELTLELVRKEIMAAGVAAGWQMTDAKPGELLATYNLRSHQAVVTIPYTTKNYSILYKNSSNLKYDAEDKTIHKNYAGWIQRLDGAIRSRLSAAGM